MFVRKQRVPLTASVLKTAEESRRAPVGRDGILNVAARLFREQGYGAVSLRRIAEAAGIKAGSIYSHFGSKDEIVVAILDEGIWAVHDRMRRAISDASGGDAATVLRAAIRAHLRALLDVSDYSSANVRIFGQVPQSVRDANLPARRAYEAEWDGLLSRLKADGALRAVVDIRRLRLMLIGALNATLEWFDPERGSAEALASAYADVFLNGVLAKRNDPAWPS